MIDAEAHNAAGPLGVSVRSPVLPGAREFVEAAEAAGIPRGDYNGRDRGQMLPPASSRTLSPRLPAGRLYRLPMDSPRFSAILPRATETCVLCRASADGDIETYVDMSRNGSPVAMAPSIAARFGCEQARQVLGVLKPQQNSVRIVKPTTLNHAGHRLPVLVGPPGLPLTPLSLGFKF